MTKDLAAEQPHLGAGEPTSQLVEPFRRLADSIPHVVWITLLHPERVIYVSPSFEQIWGRTVEELYRDPRVWTACIHPEDRAGVERAFSEWITGASPHSQRLEYRVVQPSGSVRWITDIGVVTFDDQGKPTRVSGVCTDITELKVAEREHLLHLWFFESLDRVNQAIQGADDLEAMLREVLAQLLEIFECERAWLVIPGEAEQGIELWCEPSALVRSQWDSEEAGQLLDLVGASGGVLCLGRERPVPAPIAERLGARAAMCSSLSPKGGGGRVLGLFSSSPRCWTSEQERLFQEIGRRLSDAIGTLWSVRRLRESEQRLEAAQRQAHLGYWSLDLQTSLVTFSAETFRICGLSAREKPLSLAELEHRVHPADLERVLLAARRALEEGSEQLLLRIVRPSSELRFVHSEAHVVRDAGGRAIGLFGTAQDITERKRAEQLFAAQHAVTKLLAELTSVEDAAPRILQAICETLDWDVGLMWQASAAPAPLRPLSVWCRRDVDAAAFSETLPSAARDRAGDAPWFASDMAAQPSSGLPDPALRFGMHAAFGFAVRTSGGGCFQLAFMSREIRQPDTDLLAATTTLGSQLGQFVERRRAETALQRARDQLAHVTRVASLGELTASIAHEVNQPLTGIIANAQAALRWLQRGEPELAEAIESLQRLLRDGKRAGEVVGRLRTLVRQGEATRKTSLDLNQVIRETLPLVRSEMQQNEVAIELELADALPLAHADRVQVQQVLLNLIMNAVEAMVAVRDRPRRLLLRTAELSKEELSVTVADNGVGVEPQQAARIFDAFYTTKAQGMGMGLAISRSIVEDHGGRLTLVPATSPGTALHFTLRCASPAGR
jgi:PAS domain S-box-containing protein